MLFITGTDTGVGKTHASAVLLKRFAEHGARKPRYWKPVQTGDDDDRATVQQLTGLGDASFVPTGWSFREPLSPHRAAELEDRQDEITVARLLARLQRLKQEGPLLVEGAGGLLVPLHRGLRETWVDLLQASALPIVIVARTGLGTINHTLLTVAAARQARIEIAGVLFCGEENKDNRRTIAELSGVPDLGRFYVNDAADVTRQADELNPSWIDLISES